MNAKSGIAIDTPAVTRRRLSVVKAGLLVVASAAAIGVAAVVYKANAILTAPTDDPSSVNIASLASEQASTTASVSSETAFDIARICDPPKMFGPWTRWWWPGNAVNASSLVRQLAEMDRVGIAGVEIQPVDSGLDAADDDRFRVAVASFDTPAYFANVRAVMTAARSRGMGVDLNNYSGFPAGGPHIRKADGVQTLMTAIKTVRGGQTLDVALPRPSIRSSTLFNIFFETVAFPKDFANFDRSGLELLSLAAVRVTGGSTRRTPFDASNMLTVDPGSSRVITANVKDGRVMWQAPPGRWALVATYIGPSAEPPLLFATTNPGFVVDHLRTDALLGHYNYAFGKRTGFAPFYGAPMRAIFNDSFEFRTERLAARDMLSAFRTRRGYDLEPYLPFLAQDGADNFWFTQILGYEPAPDIKPVGEIARVIHDYNQTISDLFRERFAKATANWARQRGLLTRTQVYGTDIDVIGAFGDTDIPESETLAGGGSELAVKLAASAAALYGRREVSAESFALNNRDYQDTPRRLRAMVEKLFISGVNSIIYHGTPYMLDGQVTDRFGKPGWHPFSAPGNNFSFGINISPNNPLWDDYRYLHSYVARAQQLLRAGHPDWDVLLYYPHLGVGYADSKLYTAGDTFVDGAMPDADGEGGSVLSGSPLDPFVPKRKDPRTAWMVAVKTLTEGLSAKGITWAWTNGEALRKASVESGWARIGDGRYSAIILPNVDAIAPEDIGKLVTLARQGVPIFVVGSPPTQQPGFRDHRNGDARVRASVAALRGSGGQFFARALPAANAVARRITPALSLRETGVRRVSRAFGNGGIHFITNPGPSPRPVELTERGVTGFWFDAMTGLVVPVNGESSGALRMMLPGYSGRFFITGAPVPQLSASGYDVTNGRTLGTSDLRRWILQVNTTEGPRRIKDASPGDWRLDKQLRNAAGPGTYITRFQFSAPAPGERLVLDLGLVQGVASIEINGRTLATLTTAPFELDVTDAVIAGPNNLKITVRVPPHNAFLGLSRTDERYARFGAKRKNDGWVAAGMIGPVRLKRVVDAPRAYLCRA